MFRSPTTRYTPTFSYPSRCSSLCCCYIYIPHDCIIDDCFICHFPAQVKGHSNIVGLLGMCGSTSVSQFFPERLDDLVLKPGADRLPIARVILMALDAARGLQALHEAPGGAIVHFDIKPQQLMLDKSGTLKINDLNMCWFTSLDSEGNSCLRQARASRPGVIMDLCRASCVRHGRRNFLNKVHLR